MKRILLLFAIFLSLSAFSKAQSPVSDVVWYKDTTGESPFKNPIIGMWFSNDGKTLVVPQGSQLFLVNPTDGSVMERKETGVNFNFYDVGQNKFILSTDTLIYVFDKNTYELLQTVGLPDEIKNLPADSIYTPPIVYKQPKISSNGQSLFVIFALKNESGKYFMRSGIISLNDGRFKRGKDLFQFYGQYSPDGKYFMANQQDYSYSDGPRPVIYNSNLDSVLFDCDSYFEYNNYGFSFSYDSKLFYFQAQNKIFSISLDGNFIIDSLYHKDFWTYRAFKLNDTLNFVWVYSPGNFELLMNNKREVLMQLRDSIGGGNPILSPDRKSIINFDKTVIYKLNIPYDKLTKTEDEINNINNGFKLAPNPTYDQVNYNLYLAKDEDISFNIYDLTGGLIKKEYIGKFGAGYANGVLYVGDLVSGEYLITFTSDKETIAKGKITITR